MGLFLLSNHLHHLKGNAVYLDLYAQFRADRESDKEPIDDDIVFEIELVKQVEINVDYILLLVEQYRKAKGNGTDKEVKAHIIRRLEASPSLRSKKDLVEAFVDSVSPQGKVSDQWRSFVAARREAELDSIIEDEGLQPDATHAFVARAFRDGELTSTGTEITTVIPPVSRFARSGGLGEKKQRVLDRLGAFFERFFGLAQ